MGVERRPVHDGVAGSTNDSRRIYAGIRLRSEPHMTRIPNMAHTVEPYQATASVSDSANCPGAQCRFTFPTVPAGKRLLLTSVSAQLGRVASSIVLEGNGVPYFVTKSDPALGNLTTLVSLFYEAGSTPTARVFAPDTTQHTSLIITLVGVLETL